MAFYLGIDGGGTKTRCVLGDESRVLASGVSGACNVVRVGVASARDALHSAIRQVCQSATIAPSDITNVCLGAAGAAREEIANQIRGILGEITPARVEVVGDTVIALEAGFGSGPGIIAISGTGSIVYGRNSRGETARAGGWGYAISDEGSAQWIGRRAVWAVLRALDQGAETTLRSQVLNAWNLHNLDELVQRANSVPPPEFPTLFPVVLRAAHEGDAIATALLAHAATELTEQTAIVVRRLFPHEDGTEARLSMQNGVDEHARVAMTGSVFRQSSEVRQVFYNQLRAAFPRLEIRSDLVEPVEGALALARKQRLAIGT
jgi:N-acetylglucosamine kinase-like BadF-type ATPase